MGHLAILSALRQAVDRGVFPGAVLLAAREDEIRFHEGVGFASVMPKKIRMSRGTLFDTASLTKPAATTAAVMRLVDRGVLRLEDPVRGFIPEFSGGERDRVTIRHLLNHSSGLRAWAPIYREAASMKRGLHGPALRRRVIELISRRRLVYSPGTRSLYSDLGFILLGDLVERACGLSLDRFCRREIFTPLGMENTFFVRKGRKRAGRFAATERSRTRGRILRGEVHDENAAFMGGVAGHAGLFSTASDLFTFSRMILNGLAGRPGLISKKTLEEFLTRQGTPGSSWALGWDTPSGSPRSPSSSGRFFSKRSFGHLGYTGTSLWIDPDRALTVVLLTNRVHPTSRNVRIRPFRPYLHDRVCEELFSGDRG